MDHSYCAPHAPRTLLNPRGQMVVRQIREPDPDIQRQLYARDTVKNRATGYSDGPYMADSPLSRLFFSAENEQIIQNGLRAGVHQMSLAPDHRGPPFIIAPQNATTVKTAMSTAFSMHYTDRVPPGSTLTHQVAELNRLVLDRLVPRVYSDACGHYHHLKMLDAPIQVQEMPHPRQVDRDYKQLEFDTPSLQRYHRSS